MTRLLVALSCVLAASLLLVERAKALGLSDPIGSASCADLSEEESMGDPSAGPFTFAPQSLCIKLCKRATSQCKSFTKKNYSCFLAVDTSHALIVEENCKLGSKDPKVCILTFKDNDTIQRANIKAQFLLSLSACDDWGATCQTTCGP